MVDFKLDVPGYSLGGQSLGSCVWTDLKSFLLGL